MATNSKEKQSPEYKSFHDRFSVLCDQLAANQALILPFATHLYSTNIIPKGTHQEVIDSRNPGYERANKILIAVESNISFNPQMAFKEIVIGLKQVDLMFALKELVKKFESYGGVVSHELDAIINPVTSPGSPSLVSLNDLGTNDGEPELKELMNTAGVMIKGKWKPVATHLGFDDGDIATIEDDNNYETIDCIRDMFEQWESRMTSPYLWSTLKNAMMKAAKIDTRELEKKRLDLKTYEKKYMEFAHIEPELSDLLDQVGGEVSQKWRQIGIELNLGRNTLSNISRKRRSSDMDKIIAVFSEWRSQLSSPYNWQTMLIALTVPHVNEKKLAETISDTLKLRNKK